MKTKLIFLMLLSTGVFFACNSNQNQNNQTITKSENLGQPTSDNLSDQVPESITRISDGTYEVILKNNPQDIIQTDVYLNNLESDTETFFLTITDVYSSHYHSGEYHNGNLYIIRRIGYDGYPDETWSDELWRYDSQKNGTKLFSSKGIDFRVDTDECLIAIITNEALFLLDNSGKTLKQFQRAEVVANPEASSMFGFLARGQSSIWLDNTFGPGLTGLAKVDTKTYMVNKYDLTDLPARTEFTINVYSEKLAFSDYPALFDVESTEDYAKSGAKVNLQVYDLKTKKQQLIATSVTKSFEPKWIDKNTLEYYDPNTESRVQKIIE